MSFDEQMGYERVDQSGLDVLVWKRFNERAKPPKLLKPKIAGQPRQTDASKVQVTNVINGCCGGGCHQCMMVKDAVADMR